LVRAQEPELTGFNEAAALRLVCPCSFGLIAGALRKSNVVIAHWLIDKSLGVGRYMLVASDRLGRRERGNDVWAAPLNVPKEMKVAIRQNDEAAVLRLGILPGLLFAHQGILVLCLCL
jgi:hypothetical protein